MPFSLDLLIADLKREEGFRARPYADTEGNTTIGYGRNLDANGITEDEATYLLTQDAGRAMYDAKRTFPWMDTLKEPAARALADLVFNMGILKVAQFDTFLRMLRSLDYEGAAADLERTAWFGEVGQRGPMVCARIRSAATTRVSS